MDENLRRPVDHSPPSGLNPFIALESAFGLHRPVRGDPLHVTEDLRKSHADLSSRVNQVAEECLRLKRYLADKATSVVHDEAVRNEHSLQRAKIFIALQLVRTLTGPFSETTKRQPNITAGNSVQQIFLKSKAVDCTLQEFRLLAKSSLDKSSSSCKLFPSEYYTLLANSQSGTRLEIVYRSFYDLCEALDVDVADREKAMYRERYTGHQLQAIRVLGVALTSPQTTRDVPPERAVLLGRSFSERFRLDNCLTLIQPCAIWSSGDKCWETGFRLAEDKTHNVLSNLKALSQSESDANLPGRTRKTDLNRPCPDKFVFSLLWEQIKDKGHKSCGPPSRVCGMLRALIPAVVVRSQKLTSTVDKVFSTRIRNVYLNQLLVSPPDDKSADDSDS